MSRWINADALMDSIIEKWGINPKYLDDSLDATKDVQTLEWINSAPSIDIVRCKECKAYMTDGYADGCGFCAYHQSVVRADAFCSYGEREGE